ncbi:MAG TPA: VOC family protein [Nitrososphaera sp.]|nr:VOC family protein [Nitrososphaera sp.]
MRADSYKEKEGAIHPATRLRHVSLNVSDVQRSLEFYTSILGFRSMGRPSGESAQLSVPGHPNHLVELLRADVHDLDGPRRAGLYHFAVLLPERKNLADVLAHLAENRERVHFDGLADHLVSEAIYIRDPDHIGIEIYRDRPASEWSWSNGTLQMATERLDTENLSRDETPEGWKGMPAGTTIGHVHLHVSSLPSALKFYSQILGMKLTCKYPGAYFFAAGNYHHHVAANTWLGEGIGRAEPTKIGLNHFALELPNSKAVETTLGRLARSGARPEISDGQATVHDPDEIAIRLISKGQ